MDFRRRFERGLLQGTIFAAGLLCALAIGHGFYACALVLALIAFWAGSVALSRFAAQDPPALHAPPRLQNVSWRLVSSMLDHLPAPLVGRSADGVVRAANRAARTLFGTDDRILTAPPELLYALERAAPDEKLTITLGVQGENRLFAVSRIDLTTPDAPQRLAILVDIQPEIRAAEAAVLRDMMQVLSHEIMNALTPVASLAATALDFMSDGTPLAQETARDAVETLARRAEGLSRFVEAYRTLAKLPPPKAQPISVDQLLEETAQLFRSRWPAAEVSLEVSKPTPDIVANLDVDLVVHALMNILANAADAAKSAAGGRAHVALGAGRRETNIVFVVSDNGPGVSVQDRERIFQPFYTTKAHGTGVGLSFARQVALSHGGDLTLVADGQKPGAQFELSL